MSDPTNGAYNDTEKYSDNIDVSDIVTSGLGTPTTETMTDSGGSSDDTNLSISGVPDSGGSDSETSKSTNQTTYQDTKTVAPNANRASVTTTENDVTTKWSDNTSETSPGDSYSDVGDGTYTVDVAATSDLSGTTITKDDDTHSPPDAVITGSPVNSPGLQGDSMTAAELANSFILGGTEARSSYRSKIPQSWSELTDSNGTSYPVSNATDLKNSLDSIRNKGLTIQELFIKGHGWDEGIQLTDGDNPDVLSCIQGVISLGGENITQLMDDVSGAETYIMLAGCGTAPLAKSLSSVLGDGVTISGNKLPYAVGIPWTPITFGWYWGPYVNGK